MGRRGDSFDPDLLKYGLLIFGVVTAIFIGVAILQRVRAAYLGSDEGSDDLLEAIRDAHQAGELDDDEFRRVQEELGKPSPGPIKGGPLHPEP